MLRIMTLQHFQPQMDALSTVLVELAEARVAESREGDKHLKFHNIKDVSQAMLNLQRVDTEVVDEDDPSEFGCEVGFVA